jgi:Ca2+-binding RTX toxin-like protein
MAIINVSGAGQLLAALDDARPGDTLRLAAGNYGTVELDGTRNPGLRFAGDVTVTSASPGAPAVFNDLTLRNVSNLNFENIDFTGVGGRTSGDLVTVTQSRGVTINNSDFDGRQIGGVQNGLSVTNSSDVQVSNSEFDDFYYGAGFRVVDNLRILNNNVHSMDFDGLRLAQVTNTLIQGNRLHDMDGPVDGGHRDMIQFWNTDGPSANVTIRGNTIDIGDGRMIQSLFIYNEAVLQGAGQSMFHRNFLIENNHIEGVHPHGILVGETIGLTIRGNTVVKDPTSDVYKHGWEPIIEVAARSQGVTITGNTAHEVPDAMPGWNVGGNRVVPPGFVPGNPLPPPDAAGPKPPAASPGPSPTPSPSPGGAGAGHDTVVGGAGRDMLRGLAGNDRLVGGASADVLVGGAGADVFDIDVAAHSVGGNRDVLRGGDGGKSFDGAGGAAGDRIDLSGIDANTAAAGNQAFGLGAGVGRISVVEFGNGASLVRGSVDGDAAFEVELMIEDGSTRASAYTAADFIL